MPINETITQAENNQEKSRQLDIAMNNYNKSALLYDLDEPSFFEEALDAALKSVQILKELVEIGQYEEADLIRQMAVCAYQTGRCYVRMKDRQTALKYFYEAIEK